MFAVLSSASTMTTVSETICSRAEVKGALLACQEANFLHCYNSIPSLKCVNTAVEST